MMLYLFGLVVFYFSIWYNILSFSSLNPLDYCFGV